MTPLLSPIKQIRAHDDTPKWTLRSLRGSLHGATKNKPQKKKKTERVKKSAMAMDINVGSVGFGLRAVKKLHSISLSLFLMKNYNTYTVVFFFFTASKQNLSIFSYVNTYFEWREDSQKEFFWDMETRWGLRFQSSSGGLNFEYTAKASVMWIHTWSKSGSDGLFISPFKPQQLVKEHYFLLIWVPHFFDSFLALLILQLTTYTVFLSLNTHLL